MKHIQENDLSVFVKEFIFRNIKMSLQSFFFIKLFCKQLLWKNTLILYLKKCKLNETIH